MKYRTTVNKTGDKNKNKANNTKKIQKKRESILKTEGQIMQKIIQKKSPKNKKKKDRIKISKGSPGIVIKSIIGLTSPKTSKKNIKITN